MEKNNKNELVKISKKRISISENGLKLLTYILTVIFVFAALALSFLEKEIIAETNFNNPTTTTFATVDYSPGDGAKLNTSSDARFTKTFESYRMKDLKGRILKIRKIEHRGGTKKAVYCIDRTTEFPGTENMTYHYNGSLTANYLEIPQYKYTNGRREIIKHKISGAQLGQLRWLVDQFYLRESGSLETKQVIKKNLFEKTAEYKLRKAGKNPDYNEIKKESKKYYNLTNDSDLESLQQWVLWDIANENIDQTKYQPYRGGELYYTASNPANLQTETKYMGARKDIYDYLYNTAKTKNENYKNDVKEPQLGGRPKSEQVSKTDSGLNTVGIINYGYSVAIPGDSGNKSAITKIDLYNARGQIINPSEYKVGLYGGEKPTKQDRQIALDSDLTLQDVVGEGNFFIYFKDGSKYFDENEKFTLKAKFRKIVTYPFVYIPDESYITGDKRITQSVVLLDREEKETEQSMEVEAPKGFDLALRKSIVKITNPETGEVRTFDERRPRVDESNLKTTSMGAGKENMTAKYFHPKNPINVEHGDIITYEFNIFNEDDQDKALNQIKDLLPKGLRIVPADKSSINKKLGWTEESGGRVLSLKLNNNNMLKGATKGTSNAKLNGKLTFQLELYVEDTAKEGQILTNIAEITDDEPKIDRDSVPGNHFGSYFSTLDEDRLSKYKGNDSNKEELGDKNYFYKGQEDDDDFEKVKVIVPKADLALKKFVNKINGKELEVSREPIADASPLLKGQTDAKYTFIDPKENKVGVKKGDLVEYNIRIYNEGEIDAYAKEVDDLIPDGTEFIEDNEINKNYGWKKDPQNSKRILTDILSKENEKNPGDNLLKRFNIKDPNAKMSYVDLKVVVKVIDASDPTKLINISEITKITDKNGKPKEDRDSTPGNKDPNEDDQDYEHLIGKDFDLALRKFITHIRGSEVSPSRKPEIDVTPLKENTGTTAIYKHPKNPLDVSEGDIVRYTIMVFNEGDIDGYAKEITDNLPKGLKFIKDSEINKKYGWIQDPENPRKITTDYLSKEKEIDRVNLLKAFNKKTNTLDSKFVEIEVIVQTKEKENKKITTSIENEENNTLDKLEFEAKKENLHSALIDDENMLSEITQNEGKLKYKAEEDKEKTQISGNEEVEIEAKEIKEENKSTLTKINNDENSKENKELKGITKEELEIVKLENENNLRNIADISKDEDENGNEIEDRDSDPSRKTYENKPEGSWEDDEDYEKLKLQSRIFDLALIKLITGYELTVGNDTKVIDTHHTRDTNNPEPVVKIDLDQFKLDQTSLKYIYEIEITNEGNLEGYATEISDYIPHGLKFVKEDNPNWEQKGDKIVTRELEKTLLKPGERASVKLVLRWDKDIKNFGQMTNVAEISEDKNEYNVPDRDSVPNNKKPGEDDIDDASVILALKTGMAQTFYTLSITTLSIIGMSVLGIKKNMMKKYF